MRKTELVVSGEVICPKTKASIVGHEQTNIEAYLDQQNRTSSTITQSSAMSQVGLGDDADLSFCVQDGFYESATLYGKTLVNCIQEPSSQDVVLPYAFEDGQYVTINDTKESGALGVELKGQTLVNIHKRQEYKLGRSTETIASNKFENIVAEENRISFDMVDNLTYGWGSFVNGGELDLDILKPNTKYLVYFGTASFPDYFGVSFRNGDSTSLICTQAQVNKGANYAIVTTTNEIIKNKQIIYISIPQQCVGHYEFKDIKIIEYQQGMENWDFPYFEGMTSCQMPNLHSVNQMFDYSRATTPPGGTSTSFSNDRKNLKVSFETSRNCNQNNVGTLPIGTYEVSYEIRGYVEGKSVLVSRAGIVFPNSSETWWDTSTSVTKHFKDMSTGEYTKVTKTIVVSEPVTITIIYHAWGDNAIGWCEFRNIRIVPQGKSSTLSLPEEVALRSLPNGVKDTLNLNTGEYVKRIGERVFHGTEKGWKYRNLSNNGEIAVFSANTGDGVGIEDWKIVRDAQNETVACDSFLTHQERSGIANISALNKECFAYFLDSYGVKFIYIAINKNKASDLAKLKSYLASNPITVQYQLETPIVTRINLPSTLKSWNTTTHIYSEIPEDTLYPILSHSNPSYPVILKPSTKYSIVANSYSNSHTNSAISFNLGGATASAAVGNRVTTITTPSTLSNELLTMSGRGNKLNNVMVIEGEVVGDEPYFEGICDCKSPILTNTGKNLYYMHQDINNTYGISEFYENGFVTTSLNAWGIFGLTKKDNIAEQGDNILNPTSIQEGKTYTISCKVTKISGTSSKLHFLGLRCHNHEGDVIEVSNVRWNDWELEYDFSNTVELSKTVVCNKSFNHVVFGGQIGFDGSNDVYKITDFQLEESSTPTSHEPYKSNILSCNGDKIELTEDMFEQGGVSYPNTYPTTSTFDSIKYPSDHRIRIKDLHSIKPNTTHKIKIQNGDSYWIGLQGYNNDGVPINFDTSWGWYGGECVFTTPSNMTKFAIAIRKPDSSVITLSDFGKIEFELREVDKTIVLRSLPNGVCDTLNVETGEYVQRIEEVVLDGSSDETWKKQSDIGNGKTRFIVVNKTDDRKVYSSQRTTGYLLCDKFREVSFYDLYVEGKDGVAGWEAGKTISFVNGMTVLSDFISLISQSPITLHYELETPIIKTVDLSGYPFSYKNGHVILSSGSIEQSLTPKVEYVVQTNRAGAIQANQDRLLNHDKRLAMLEDLVLHQLIQLEYNRAKCTFLSQTRQIVERGIQMHHTKYELLSEFIEKKLYRSLEEVFEMLDVYFMLGDLTDGEYDTLYETLMPSTEEIFEDEMNVEDESDNW